MYNSGFVDHECVKSKKGMSKYYTEFELSHNNFKSCELFIGICRKYKHKNDVGYMNSDTIYLWCFDGQMRINNEYYKYTTRIFPGSRVGVLLDMDLGTLEYVVNDVKKGVAYKDPSLKTGEFFFDIGLFFKGDQVKVLKQG